VHAVGIREACEIGAIVDDHAAAGAARRRHDAVDQSEQPAARIIFGSDLQEPCAAA
jgi:hypothetical protein